MHTDILVIGSGPIGIAAARRLAEQGYAVTVLEAGPAITDPPASHLRNQPRFRNDPDSFFAAVDPYLARAADADGDLPGAADSSLVGGQGILWTNNCPRMADFERWDAMTPAEWALWYGQAENMLQVAANPTAASRTGRVIHGLLSDMLTADSRDIRGLPLAGRILPDGAIHFVAPEDIRAAPPSADLIDIRPGVRVAGVRRNGSRATGVEAIGPTGNRTDLTAETIIVAGGAIATPRLLRRSGIVPDALGHALSFHALLVGQVVLAEADCPSAGDADIAPRLWIPPTPAAPWHIQVARDTCPLPAAEPVANPHRLVEFQAFVPIELRDENALLIDDNDRIRFRFRFSDTDRQRMRAMEADVRRLAARLGPWRRGCEPTWAPHGAAHLFGTCRMDLAGRTGVTDRIGKVHGLENLYLATVGLIPAPIAVNPTLTAVALALRTCDAIATKSR